MSYVTPLYEHAYYVGNVIGSILYGVELAIYVLTICALQKNRSQKSGLGNRFFLVYSTVLLVLLTIERSTASFWGQMMWITGRSYDPNDERFGIDMWVRQNTAVWYHRLVNPVAFSLTIFVGDGLLIWRLYIIFNSKWYVIVIPCLVYLTAFVLAVLELLSRVIDSFLVTNGGVTGIPYYTLTICMNLVTLLMCIRLFLVSRKTKQIFGEESARTYTGIAAILIESAMPYSIAGIAFLVAYARGSSLYVLFQQIWATLACLSPQFIILRVATGKAWQKETSSRVASSLHFQHSQHHRTDQSDTSEDERSDTLNQENRQASDVEVKNDSVV